MPKSPTERNGAQALEYSERRRVAKARSRQAETPRGTDIHAVHMHLIIFLKAYENLAASSLAGTGSKVKRSLKATNLLQNSENRNVNVKNSQNLQQSGVESSVVGDKLLIDQLSRQVSELTSTVRKLEEDKIVLEGSVKRREHELGREMQKVASLALQTGDTSTVESKFEMLLMADGANSRIIDQLNGQIDFLNDQLAIRESQLSELGEKMLDMHEIRSECENR